MGEGGGEVSMETSHNISHLRQLVPRGAGNAWVSAVRESPPSARRRPVAGVRRGACREVPCAVRSTEPGARGPHFDAPSVLGKEAGSERPESS